MADIATKLGAEAIVVRAHAHPLEYRCVRPAGAWHWLRIQLRKHIVLFEPLQDGVIIGRLKRQAQVLGPVMLVGTVADHPRLLDEKNRAVIVRLKGRCVDRAAFLIRSFEAVVRLEAEKVATKTGATAPYPSRARQHARATP